MKRLRIDRINLHLRNVPAATAQEAADLLGPALGRAVASAASGRDVESALRRTEHDAGNLVIGTAPSAHTLASAIAQRIAAKTSKG